MVRNLFPLIDADGLTIDRIAPLTSVPFDERSALDSGPDRATERSGIAVEVGAS